MTDIETVPEFTHLDASGAALMTDVSAKAITQRRATASATVTMNESTLEMVTSGTGAKGDVLSTARLAGIMGAKRTPDIIPLCHPLAIEGVAVSLQPQGKDQLYITATVVITARTGVEMEAISAVMIAALTVYDMCKSVDKTMTITDVRLEEKSGGNSGYWRRQEAS
jgi:cyclic pyranopterin monophosphate synthase